MDVSAPAISLADWPQWSFGSPVFARVGKTDTPSSSHSLAIARWVKGIDYVIDSLLSLRSSCAVMAALIDQPTTRRENGSITAADREPALGRPERGEVGDPFLVRSLGGEPPIQEVR